MKIIFRLLFALHVFVGLGAIYGGLVTIFNPEKPFGMTVEVLKNSPFNNYLIPGIILFTIIGLGNVFSAVTICFKSRFQGYISSVFGWALVIWIVVQCIMINMVHAAHVVFFAIGVIEVALATTLIFKQRLFPANYLLDFYKKVGKEI